MLKLGLSQEDDLIWGKEMSLYRHTIHGFFALFQKPTGSHTYLLRQEDLKEEAL